MKKMQAPSKLPELNTRSYPRTMQEAFGPYTSSRIETERDTGYPTWWWAAMAIVGILSVVVIVTAPAVK